MDARMIVSQAPRRIPRRGWLLAIVLAAIASAMLPGCYGRNQSLFTLLGDARHEAAGLRLQFNKAADASNLAVMSDVKETSAGFAEEAERAKQAIRQEESELRAHLLALGYSGELQLLDEFHRGFDEYEKLDQNILRLAEENTNVRARKLSFGPAQQDADAFRNALESMVQSSPAKDRCRVDPLVRTALVALLQIQTLHAPHIAEADDKVMTKQEEQMARLEESVRSALKDLEMIAPDSAPLADANAAFGRFEEEHLRILALSRKNTNVVTLAMSLGQKRAVSTSCDASLASLEQELRRRGAVATR